MVRVFKKPQARWGDGRATEGRVVMGPLPPAG